MNERRYLIMLWCALQDTHIEHTPFCWIEGHREVWP